MRPVPITKYLQLTEKEWRVVATQVKKQVLEITGKECEIGLGRKYRNDRPYGWQIAIRVYLPVKRKRVAEAKLVPPHFILVLPGKGEIRVRSDVDSLSKLVPTAAKVTRSGAVASTGVLVRWTDNRERHWGFLTVAHFFDETRRRNAEVRLGSSANSRFSCQRKRTADEPLDVVLLEIKGDTDEVEAKLIANDLICCTNPEELSVLSPKAVRRATSSHKAGRTFPQSGSRTFKGEEVLLDGFPIKDRRLDDCIRVVHNGRRKVFDEGTSGAHWRYGNDLACMQVGGKKPEFREGIGQPLQVLRTWMRRKVSSSAKIVAVFGVSQQEIVRGECEACA